MKDFLIRLIDYSQIKKYRLGFILSLIFIVLTYGCYFGLDRQTAIKLAVEDGIFEYLTATLFILSSIIFSILFFKDKNWFFLTLAIVFFVGCGEEISWGQRLLGFKTPESMEARNIQNEFNLHNLDVFHPQDGSGSKTGLAKLITVDFLYNVFWMSWGILIPGLLFVSKPLKVLSDRFRFPVPVLSIGVLFAFNFILLVVLRKLTMVDKSDLFYQKVREVFEVNSAWVFVVLAYIFYRIRKK